MLNLCCRNGNKNNPSKEGSNLNGKIMKKRGRPPKKILIGVNNIHNKLNKDEVSDDETKLKLVIKKPGRPRKRFVLDNKKGFHDEKHNAIKSELASQSHQIEPSEYELLNMKRKEELLAMLRFVKQLKSRLITNKFFLKACLNKP